MIRGNIIAAASKVTLAAGETRKVTIVFAWNIPMYVIRYGCDLSGDWPVF